MNKEQYLQLKVGDLVKDRNGNVGEVIAISGCNDLWAMDDHWASVCEVHCDNNEVSMFPDELEVIKRFVYKSAFEVSGEDEDQDLELFFIYRNVDGELEYMADVCGPEDNAKLIVEALNSYTRKQ